MCYHWLHLRRQRHGPCLWCEKRTGGGESLTSMNVDSDDGMHCHCLDDVPRPLMCQAIFIVHHLLLLWFVCGCLLLLCSSLSCVVIVHQFFIATSPAFCKKGMREGDSHVDCDDNMHHHSLDNVECPLTCQVIVVVHHVSSSLC